MMMVLMSNPLDKKGKGNSMQSLIIQKHIEMSVYFEFIHTRTHTDAIKILFLFKELGVSCLCVHFISQCFRDWVKWERKKTRKK